MLSNQEIKNLDQKDLHSELLRARHDLLKVLVGVKSGSSKESHLIRNLKKYIARLLTLLNQKNLSKTLKT